MLSRLRGSSLMRCEEEDDEDEEEEEEEGAAGSRRLLRLGERETAVGLSFRKHFWQTLCSPMYPM